MPRKPAPPKALVLFLTALAKAPPKMQECVGDMLEVINESGDEQEINGAWNTILEALFPGKSPDGKYGYDLEELESFELPTGARPFKSFSDLLLNAMEKAGLSQVELAKKLGITQPAVSLMLQRETHPQRRTIAKLAKVLKVKQEELWPY